MNYSAIASTLDLQFCQCLCEQFYPKTAPSKSKSKMLGVPFSRFPGNTTYLSMHGTGFAHAKKGSTTTIQLAWKPYETEIPVNTRIPRGYHPICACMVRMQAKKSECQEPLNL